MTIADIPLFLPSSCHVFDFGGAKCIISRVFFNVKILLIGAALGFWLNIYDRGLRA